MPLRDWDMLKYAALSEAERKKADAYAGPGDSFPLYKNGEHLAAAWDLAGHADNPDEVRARIKAFAREHGLEGHLPASAHEHADMVKKAVLTAMMAKAKTSDIASLLQMAYRHEAMEGDKFQQANLAHFAKAHGISHLLPAEAHTVMHEEGIVHEHEGMKNDDNGMHEHTVEPEFTRKAFVSEMLVCKAWGDEKTVFVEGWVATADRDLDRDIVVPEAFTDSIDGFAALGMPCSSAHDDKPYPKGHGQKMALVRDGNIFKAAVHPTDAAEFEHFPGFGTGVYGRVAITESDAAGAIRKGNVRGFSWTGKPAEKTPLADGGHRITKVNPWVEICVAAYPVNPSAHMLAAH